MKRLELRVVEQGAGFFDSEYSRPRVIGETLNKLLGVEGDEVEGGMGWWRLGKRSSKYIIFFWGKPHFVFC